MNNKTIKKYMCFSCIICALCAGSYTTEGKENKKHPKKTRNVNKTPERPNDNTLMQQLVDNVEELKGQRIVTLSIKDLIHVFETYIENFISSADPFSWELRRLELFVKIFNHHAQQSLSLSNDLENHKSVYSREFGITTQENLQNSLITLSCSTRSFYRTMNNTNNRTVAGLMGALDQFVTYLKKNLPPKFSKRVSAIEERFSTKIKRNFSLVSQIIQRLKQ